jgi:RNA polymerase sigma factor (sigma-70 family)
MKTFPARETADGYMYHGRAHRVADALYQDVAYLFSPKLYRGQVPSKVSVEVGLEALTTRNLSALPPTPEASAMASEERAILTQALTGLTPNEATVLTRHYGLDGSPEANFTEIAEEIHLSSARIQQIHEKAIRKLRQPSQLRALRPAYVGGWS